MKNKILILIVIGIFTYINLNPIIVYASMDAVMKIESEVSENCEYLYDIEGDKTVDVYSCETLYQDQNYNYNVVAVASFKGTTIQIDKQDIGIYKGTLILHELGHSLGYHHKNSSNLMNYKPFEPHKKNLSKIEVNIAENFSNLKIINWSNPEDVKYIKNEKEKLGEKMRSIDNKIGKECSSIYYKPDLYKNRWLGDRFYNQCSIDITLAD